MLDDDLNFYLREYKSIFESIRDSLRSIAKSFEEINMFKEPWLVKTGSFKLNLGTNDNDK